MSDLHQPTRGGLGGMLPQENLKFSAFRMPFSYILRATQAIKTHKNMKNPFKVIEPIQYQWKHNSEILKN